MTMNLPIFPYNYVSFCNIYFKVTLLGAIQGDISCVCVCFKGKNGLTKLRVLQLGFEEVNLKQFFLFWPRLGYSS